MKFYTALHLSLSFDYLSDSSTKFGIYDLGIDKSDYYQQFISKLTTSLGVGEVAFITNRALPEFTPFLSHMGMPIFNIFSPNTFMSRFDEYIEYADSFINHDIEHEIGIKNQKIYSSVSQYLLAVQKMDIKPSLNEMKSVIKSKLNLNLIEIKKINIILSKLPTKDRNVLYAFIFHYFHEELNNGINLTQNEYSLGKALNKYFKPENSFYAYISEYNLSQADVNHFTATLKSLQKQIPNIFESNSDIIVRAFTKYLKNK